MKGCYAINGESPVVAEDVFLAPGSRVIGKVKLDKGVSVWFNTVIRGDVNYMEVGEYSNIQDSCVMHGTPKDPTLIGRYVSVGHQVVLHGCIVHDYCLIGVGSILLEGVEVGEGSVIGAGSLVLRGTKIPPYSLVVGSPAKVIKTLDPATLEDRRKMAVNYHKNAMAYRESLTTEIKTS